MAKNIMKKSLLTALTAGALLSNQNVNADILTNTCGGGISSSKLILQRLAGANDNYDVNDFAYLEPSPLGGNNYKFVSKPYGSELSIDSRPTNSEAILMSNIGVVNAGTSNTNISSPTTIIKYNFAGGTSGIDSNRLYLTKIHANGAYRPSQQDFDLITNITENLSVTLTGGITNVPNRTNFASVINSCLFTNQFLTNANTQVWTNDLTMGGKQVDGITYEVLHNPVNGTATINGTNLVYTPTNYPASGIDNVDVNLKSGANVLGTIRYSINATNNPNNHYPTNGLLTAGGTQGVTSNLSIAKYFNYKIGDADGDLVSLVSAGPSTNGTVVSVNGDIINYTPGATNSEFFPYVVKDTWGAKSTNYVNLSNIISSNAPSMNIVGVDKVGNTATIKYCGVPGYSYALDKTTNSSPFSNWKPINTNTAILGITSISDVNATNNPSAFYRMRSVSN